MFLRPKAGKKIVDEESDSSTSVEPIQRLGGGGRFRIPLENAGVEVDQLSDEFNEMVLHATQFYSLSTMGYRSVGGGFSTHPMLRSGSTVRL